MKKSIIKYIGLAPTFLLLCGCLHAPLPKASDAIAYGSATPDGHCPDLSGKFSFIGDLVDSEGLADQREIISMVFPIADREAYFRIQDFYRKSDSGERLFPDYAEVTHVADNSYEVNVKYNDSLSLGTYKTWAFVNGTRVQCNGGVAALGGAADRHTGSNTSYMWSWIWINEDGDLMHEKRMNVDMNIPLLLPVPAGTAKYYSQYLFHRLK